MKTFNPLNVSSNMTNQERLAYAEKKLDEAIRSGTVYDQTYWRGFCDGVQRAVEREEAE